MRRFTAVLGLGLFVLPGLAQAQERFDPDKAPLVAALLALRAKAFDNVPLKTDVETSKPYGVHEGEHGVMVIPQKDLSAETLDKADKEVAPIGQMWARLLAPAVDGRRVDQDKLQLVIIPLAEGEDRTLSAYFLGVKAGDDKKPVLVVYSKGKDPLLTVPLSTVEATNEMPIDLKAEKTGDEEGDVTLTIAGKYRGVIRFRGLED